MTSRNATRHIHPVLFATSAFALAGLCLSAPSVAADADADVARAMAGESSTMAAMRQLQATTPIGASLTAPDSMTASTIPRAALWQDENASNSDDAADHPSTSNTSISFQFQAGYLEQLSADIDNSASEVSVSRLLSRFNVRMGLDERSAISFRFEFANDSYDFSGVGGAFAGPGPWSDAHTFGFSVLYNRQVNDKWALFVGPLVSVQRESGADIEDAILGGGVAGFSYSVNDNLRLGGGLAVSTDIEDDIRIFPIITVHWQINDTMRLGTPNIGWFTGQPGLEFHWQFVEHWSAGIGAGYQRRRFRLDNTGVAPGGVGEDTNFPLWLRLSWLPTANITLSAVGGLTFAGELLLEDSAGNQLAEEDYDPSAIFGIFGTVRF